MMGDLILVVVSLFVGWAAGVFTIVAILDTQDNSKVGDRR